MTVSITSVARKAGVARSTVSLVLRNQPRVSSATRAAVMAAVKELGYTKREPGRPRRRPGEPLSVKRTNRIALVVPDMLPSTLSAPVYLDVLQGVESAIHAARKTLILRHVSSGQTDGGTLLFARADGVLVFGGLNDPEWVRQLEDTPVVQLMQAANPDERWDRVTYDNARIGTLVADYALARKHRSCAFVGHLCNRAEVAMQRRGLDFRAALHARGVKVHLLVRYLLNVTDRVHEVQADAMRAVADELKALVPRPTLVFVEADMMAQSLYPALRSRGLQPGKDIEVVSCNNEMVLLAGLVPRPATVDIHAAEIGRRAVQRLLWRIRNPGKPPDTLLIAPSLLAGSD